MKRTTLTVALIFTLASPLSVFAQEQAITEILTESSSATAAVDTEIPTPASSETISCMHGKAMKHKGQCHHGKGHGGSKHSCKYHKKEKHEKHAQVVQRLDMIEARMAKIEAMLETLMRR